MSRPPPHMPRTARGFTLIEVLAVVVISAMIVIFATTSLHSVTRTTELMRTKGGLVQMDARGRLHARSSGEAVAFEVDADGRVARLVGTQSRERLAEVYIPQAIGLAMELPRDARRVVFDRRGASVDYAMVLRDDVRIVRLRVAGLTGEIIESEVLP